MYYPSSENKGDDQLRGYREADLRLCFRPCRLLVFPWGGSNVNPKMIRTILMLASVSIKSIACGNIVVHDNVGRFKAYKIVFSISYENVASWLIIVFNVSYNYLLCSSQ